MAQDSTLHIKLDKETGDRLKRLALRRGKSKGQLVREAIAACYQASFIDLPLQQRDVLSAYRGGYISIGKLARVMGKHVLEMRAWLKEHDIPLNHVFGEEDTANA